MAADELGRTEVADVEDSRRPGPSPEHPGDRQPRATDATRETGDREPGGRDQQPAETQTRDDYADNMRDQGAPIPPEDHSIQDDTHDRDELHTPADKPRGDTSGQDQGDPRDRETYADDMRRAEPTDAGLEGTPDRDDVQSEPAPGTPSEDDLGQSGIDEAESRSREEYANDMREGSDPLAGGTGQSDAPEARGNGSETEPLSEPLAAQDAPPETQDDPGSGSSADSTDPGGEAEAPAAGQPADATLPASEEAASGSDRADILAETSPAGSSTDGRPGEQPAEPDQAQGAAEQGDRSEAAAGADSGLQAAAASDQNAASISPVGQVGDSDTTPAGALLSADQADHEQADDHPADTEVASQSALEQSAGTEPGHEQDRETALGEEEDPAENAGPDRVYEGGKEYQLTGNPRDGIWISGLPGDAPGTPEGDPYGRVEVGDMLPGEEKDKGKFDKFADALYENVDELSDRLESLGEKVQRFLDHDPPPTHPGAIHDHPTIYATPAAEHGVDGGHLLSAALALAVLGTRLHQIHREKAREKAQEVGPNAGQ
jgi:hypothetical protein